VSEPEQLDQFIVALDALYARREVLTARLDYLTLATTAAERAAAEQEEIETLQREHAHIDERIAVLKERLDSGRTGLG
jgi:hypothetical protein